MADLALTDFGPRRVGRALAVISRTQNKSVPQGSETSLAVMGLRIAQPEARMAAGEQPADLAYIRLVDDELRIGSLTTRSELLTSQLVAGLISAVREAVHASPCEGPGVPRTIGATLCRAGRSDAVAAALIALRASIVIRSQRGRQIIPVRDFCQHRGTILAARGDLIAEIRVPVTSVGGGWRPEPQPTRC
jgi:CO/xanthine dehydrogenase FAD-binding subunit